MIESAYVDVEGALAYVQQAGQGAPVLCLHTAGQSGVQWRHTIVELARLGYRVVVPDLPGHGRSEPSPAGPVRDLRVYTRWCMALVDELRLERPYFVVGCSIGGKIALDMAVRAGSELAGVVAIAADAHNTSVSVRALERELEDIAAPSRTDRTYLGTLAVIGRSVPVSRAKLISTMHRREDPTVSTSDLIGWATHDLRDVVASIGCGVYLVVGDDDLWLDPEQVRWVASQIPSAHYTLLEGIGHYPMEEIEGFSDMLHGWLTEVVPRRWEAMMR